MLREINMLSKMSNLYCRACKDLLHRKFFNKPLSPEKFEAWAVTELTDVDS